ncbi:outer membrane lipoprotein chaperone LolA [Thiococcus pfennigii]|jgi:outer membrane lipoprotein carrier protein|uniref:outer membrane lipoprotein chaperone LolA n=1 Tax=Thiococcus pfennigii TaxID=1057 RepID=UPI001902E828|nr:outer membrane lipoprotein chaperone LolA [Thiococcus pfennigii]MBK1733553.1 outer membrane lipoprotein carrier protein LolA [Thiococcus pfennigii]
MTHAIPIRPPRHASVLGLVLLLAALALVGAPARAADGAARLDGYLDGLTTLQADFHQVTFNSDRTQMLESDGRLYLERPGRFRWEYRTPFAQVIIADGKRVYVHDLELEQVYHRSQQAALRGTPALLLTQDEPIEDLFVVTPMEEGGERDWVALRPRDPDTEIERIEIGFDGEQLDTLLMFDRFGQVTHLRFADIRRNQPLEDDLFRFDHSTGGDFLEFD